MHRVFLFLNVVYSHHGRLMAYIDRNCSAEICMQLNYRRIDMNFFENHTVFIQLKLWRMIYLSSFLFITQMPINISFLKSKDCGGRTRAQINAFWTVVLLKDEPIWMHEYEIQSISFYIVRALKEWSLVKVQWQPNSWYDDTCSRLEVLSLGFVLTL